MLTRAFAEKSVLPGPVRLVINARSGVTLQLAACLVQTAPTTRPSARPTCLGPGSGSTEGEDELANKEDSSCSPSERVTGAASTTISATEESRSPRERSAPRNLWSSMLPPEIQDSLPQSEYLGESLGLFMLQSDRRDMDIYHPLSWGSISAPSGLDPLQFAMLNQQGAFTLPYQELCDELIEDFFERVAPVVPVVSRTVFMAQYKGTDETNPPSLLLLQSMLLAASKISRSSRLPQATGSNAAASALFYKRAKSLYDAGFETDRIVILQSVILMGWYCEDPRGVGTTFYWSRIAIALAQSIGIHRSVTSSVLSLPEKRLYKRIWWTLFTRDRLLSVCLGRPMAINLADCDVELLQDQDFDEVEDGGSPGAYPANPIHTSYFTQYVKLCKIMGEIFATYYSATSKVANKDATETHLQYDQRLTEWLQQRPPEMVWGKRPHEFWAAILHLHYCTAICLLHRARMPAGAAKSSSSSDSSSTNIHLSREAAYDAASCITDIVETLMSSTELNFAPPFVVYTLYSALLVHVHRIHETRSSNLFLAAPRAGVCLCALLELSTTWTVATLMYTMFCHLLTSGLKRRETNTSGDQNDPSPGQLGSTAIIPHMHPVDDVSFSNVDPSLVATGNFDLQMMGLLPSEGGGFTL
ncbi:fungal-specific transcription factor domain-containing protein [Aspergillus pseudodeflectus]|uniref:Fungal-specific transcription factor domain-containing protein n=1 Tax=Aspergillus pseudodeflectus TaxID=176178 RepID=A0ABR4KZC7_9EURO